MPASLVEVLWTARYDYQPCWKLEHHSHKYFQMICFRRGKGRFFLEDREQPLAPGMVVLIKPGQTHGLSASTLVKTLDIKFLVNDAQLKRSLWTARSFIVEEEARTSALFERIRWEGEHQGMLFQEMCKAYLVQILIAYLRKERGQLEIERTAADENETAIESDPISRRVVDFIKQRYAEDLSVQGIARALGVSDRHLRQRFKESAGMPPMRYLARYRVGMAKELIQYSTDALKLIAEMTGFKSIHHFSHVFLEITGETPGAWRRRYHEGICKDICIDPHFSNVILIKQEDKPAKSA